MTKVKSENRREHYRITWTPTKPAVFHTQSPNWLDGLYQGGKKPRSAERRWKTALWPERKEWSWRQRLVTRWLDRDKREFKNREAADPPRKYRLVERFKDLRLPAVDWLAVVWGWVASLAITLVVLAAAAFYVALTPGSVFYLSTYLFLNKVVSPLLGGVLAGMRAKTAAALVGLWVGLGYGIIVLVFRLYGGLFDFFWTEALTGLLASLFAGAAGAILGATLAASRTTREKRRGIAVG